MRYHVIHIQTRFKEDWKYDIFDQHMGELGVDTIQGQGEPINGYKSDYYITSERWEQNCKKIEAFIRSEQGARLLGVEACPDRNWNETWEAEHPMMELPLGVTIVPHCAFGAGHHETTSMMINTLLSSDLSDKNVLDHGTGTGVLAIFAKRLGAANVVAVDIDEKSVENAKENAELNHEEIEVRLGDSVPKGLYNLILANIHRNVLLANMNAYASSLQEGGELWMSGFYEEDCPVLQAAAEKEGLQLIDVLANSEWRLMRCRKAVRL